MKHDFINILNTANSFLRAAERSEKQRSIEKGKFEMLLVPAVTNRAFSIELYLKAILLEENNPSKGHKLHVLFKELKIETKESIIKLCNLSSNEVTEKLQNISNLFVEWRYIFELESANLNLEFLKVFSIAVRKSAELKQNA